ncbi:glycosyltransferase family protein [Sphingobacterium corticibacterium]|uniref:Sugar transferase n=1 Tax=Sphingobacterium corticibacterium TaxID=2484746 RepID=A0A4Q6XTJ6_9SPHI|nr:sugar transferase [Sphingobacterium corticibacterium]RZF60119.1 sugar transferase [Sphingobacterium corticibacterium]
MQTLAPIILFVYNRPKHTRRTLVALEKNLLAKDSLLYIISDAAKNADAVENVNHVRAIIREPWDFKHITIMERQKNWGLAENVIDGVTKIIEEHGKAIILEDDLETAPYALTYFNDALHCYEHDERVMEISGYMYPIENPKRLPKTFFFRVANSWGWATWKRAWKQFNPDINALTKHFKRKDIRRFSIEGTENFWKQVKEYKAGKINSWAIRWYLSVFNQDGLVLYPRHSMVQNIGTDGSGTHSDIDDVYHVELATQKVKYFPREIRENEKAYEAIKHFYAHRKGNIAERLIRFLIKKFGRK